MISILQNIDQKKLDAICEMHYQHILSPTNAHHLILDELRSLTTNSTIELKIKEYLIANFEKLICGKPYLLEYFIRHFNNNRYSTYLRANENFKNLILNAFNYKAFRGWVIAVKIAQELDIKSCPYCNAQYTLVTKDKSKNKLLFQLDHFYPKTIYPYLSMSFYNLIPTCASCNNTKSKKPTMITDSYHPYVNESLANDFSFEVEKLDVAEAYYARKNDYKIRIKDESSLKTKASKHLKDFSISKLYARHNDIVEELVWKKYIYTEKYKKSLIDTYFDHGHLSKAELERMIINNYTEEKDILRRPLSKFMTDIAIQLDLIKK